MTTEICEWLFDTVMGHLLAEKSDMLHICWGKTPMHKYRGTKSGCIQCDYIDRAV